MAEAEKLNLHKYIFKLPFVYTYERSDYVVVIRGANIYPENIRSALQEKRISNLVTGKFTMSKLEDKHLNEYLKIYIELRKNINNTKANCEKIRKTIVNTLSKENSEFNYLYTTEGKGVAPKVDLLYYEHPEYFPSGKIKQKWVKK
jgi:phenylacetate-coenzyme A ligase PaaK-like adenylate-forming protein